MRNSCHRIGDAISKDSFHLDPETARTLNVTIIIHNSPALVFSIHRPCLNSQLFLPSSDLRVLLPIFGLHDIPFPFFNHLVAASAAITVPPRHSLEVPAQKNSYYTHPAHLHYKSDMSPRIADCFSTVSLLSSMPNPTLLTQNEHQIRTEPLRA